IGGKAHVEVVALDQSLTSMRRRNIGAHQQMSAENGERDVHDVSLLFFRDRGSTLHRRDVAHAHELALKLGAEDSLVEIERVLSFSREVEIGADCCHVPIPPWL